MQAGFLHLAEELREAQGTSHPQPSVFQGAWRKARAAAGREDLREGYRCW